jgi:TPP-dependent 2-oxoacid decarboxylase
MAGSKGDFVTVGEYLGQRLVDAGASAFFTVPGDYNLTLLDELLKVENLSFVGCCNELNAGYAADGYARATGKLGVIVGKPSISIVTVFHSFIVTYMVGALSAINAVAGAFAHDLPLLIVVGSPNTLDLAEKRVVHHTLGIVGGERQCLRCFEPVVTHSYSIDCANEAAGFFSFF